MRIYKDSKARSILYTISIGNMLDHYIGVKDIVFNSIRSRENYTRALVTISPFYYNLFLFNKFSNVYIAKNFAFN